ncbi:MAG: glycine betaine ABC transporter substrate-binding protein [Bdellovibrionales bacterium]
MIATILALCLSASYAESKPVVVGSKKFTESVLLAEIARLSLLHEGLAALHNKELGGTRILWNALLNGDVDAYVEYTGTLADEILREKNTGFDELKTKLAKLGVGVLPPLGFNNTYAVGMRRSVAEQLKIKKISDLANHPNLKIGWGDEFRLRNDGWPGLKKRYDLPHQFVRGMDHDIAYRALESGDIQVTDLYSTDAEIAYYDLLILEDDLKFFPRYEAVFLYRMDLAQSNAQFFKALNRMSGKISDATMIAMNRRAKVEKIPAGVIAAEFLNKKFGLATEHRVVSRSERIFVRSKEHVALVFVSLFFAILAAIPLGILAEKIPGLGRGILLIVGIIQTIPALALLVALIRPLNMIGLRGIGDTPALIALFLYGLLPIVRSTHTGFQQISATFREAAAVLCLRLSTRLFRVEIPLALPMILSGIKTSAVMCVGFATLGALVGAGGYGQPILAGIRLDDYGLILEGAIPAAVLALVVQQFFDFVERRLVSPGLRSTGNK